MPTCFVVMGFGLKTDYAQQKTFDLDKSYRNLIKPAVEAAGFTCIRADEIQHAGNINIPMYEQLLNADLVIADLSTANLNAFFELGIRYALKPRTTIVIAESGFIIPFDMGQVVIRRYQHLGPGLDYDEVIVKKQELTQACTEVVAASRDDSPVYTFLTNLAPPMLRGVAAAQAQVANQQTRVALGQAETSDQAAALTLPLAALMAKAMEARAGKRFGETCAILAGVKAVQGAAVDPFVIQQLALATYKQNEKDPATLMAARAVLSDLSPDTSIDPETLGLWAVHKRLFDAGGSTEMSPEAALDVAIEAYGRGFVLKHDYYNGINFAFLLDTRAAASSGNEAIADHVHARRVRTKVLSVCDEALAREVKAESAQGRAEAEYWLRATRAEARLGLREIASVDEALSDAANMTPAPESWMIDTTASQLRKLARLLGM